MNQRRLFLGCFVSMIATGLVFAIRGAVLKDWGHDFNLSEAEKGMINGAGLYPFAITIILFSLIQDKIGYGRSMAIAFLGQIAGSIITITATNKEMIYVGTFVYALGNGVVEAVINPVVATIYGKNKTHWLNVLHAGWPAGLVLGGLISIAVILCGQWMGQPGDHVANAAAQVGQVATGWTSHLGSHAWRLQMGFLFVPTILYGLLLLGQRFPVQERVAAGVSYREMLGEFGWASGYICSFLLVIAVNQVLEVFHVQSAPLWVQALIALIPAVPFGLYVRSFGRPMFVFLMLVMFLLATTELGTDTWISDIMQSVLKSQTLGILFIVYTSTIMFFLRFFAGPIVHKLSPLGLLAVCSAIACGGLLWLSSAGSAAFMLFLAATIYGCGKSFFWPTTLGIVSEQYPRGGALTLNAIAGAGVLAVGLIGSPLIGTVQDQKFVADIEATNPSLAKDVTKEKPALFGGTALALDTERYDATFAALNDVDTSKPETLTDAQKKLLDEKKTVDDISVAAKQASLAKIAVLPAGMFVCYVILLIYFRAKGGYRAEVLAGHAAEDERFTGGVPGASEA